MNSLKAVVFLLLLTGITACNDANSESYDQFCDRVNTMQTNTCPMVKVNCKTVRDLFSDEIIEAARQCGKEDLKNSFNDLTFPENIGLLPCCR